MKAFWASKYITLLWSCASLYLHFKAPHWELDPVFIDKSFILPSWIIQGPCQTSLLLACEKEILKSYAIVSFHKNQTLFKDHSISVIIVGVWVISHSWNTHRCLKSIRCIECIWNGRARPCVSSHHADVAPLGMWQLSPWQERVGAAPRERPRTLKSLERV